MLERVRESAESFGDGSGFTPGTASPSAESGPPDAMPWWPLQTCGVCCACATLDPSFRCSAMTAL